MSEGKVIARWLKSRLEDRQRFLLLCILIGLSCGVSAVMIHKSIHWLFEVLWGFAVGLGGWKFYGVMVAAPGLAGLVVGLAVKFFTPESAGSGIPQTKVAYYNRGGRVSLLTGMWRFLLTTLYCGLGNSLGREGPTVHVSSAISSRLGRWMFQDPRRVGAALPVGMAAGIAAAFNAPLSAITFVFEELLDNFSMKALGGIVVAVVIAAAVGRTMLGEDPVLDAHFVNQEYVTSPWMVVGIPMGLAAGLLGHFFVSSVLRVRKLNVTRLKRWSWLTPAVGGICCGLLGILALELTGMYGQGQRSVFSIGYESLELAFEDKLVWQVLGILLVCKFVAVVLNYGTGGSGGLFSPTLYLGGMLGGMVGWVVVLAEGWFEVPNWPGTHEVLGGCVLLGMGAMFSAVVRAPFTSLIIIFEMTRNYSLILPLMAGNMLAWSIARRLRPVAIYDALLLQDGVSLKKFAAYRGSQDYEQLPVSTIMSYDVTTLEVGKSVGENVGRFGSEGLVYHSYPILDGEGELEGIVTRHELEMAGGEELLGKLIVGQELVTAHPGMSIREAAQLMISKNYQCLPVVSQGQPGKLLGVITLNDIARQQNASAL